MELENSSESSGDHDESFIKITEERKARFSAGLSPDEAPRWALASVITSIRDAILASTPPDVTDRISRNVAFGTLNTGDPVAFITKSRDDKVAIVIGESFMVLLHKCEKLTTAALDPGQVIYCNRKAPETLTRHELIEYKLELIENQHTHGAPRGVMIQLSDRAMEFTSRQLHLVETLVVCHEVGHLLNGDLDDDQSFSLINGRGWMRKYEENKDHRREYRADETGFNLAIKAVGAKTLAEKKMLLLAAIGLFDHMYLLVGGASSSHPDPLDRAVHLTLRVFGKKAARAVQQSYRDGRKLLALFSGLSRANRRWSR